MNLNELISLITSPRSIIQQGKVDSGSTQGRNTFSFNPVGIISPVSSHSHFLAQVASPCEEIPASVSSGWLSSFAPPEIISQILDDWFDRIHPVAPVLLRRHFMHRLESREADTNPEFCALVVSVCAAARATLPGENYGLVEISTCAEYIDKYRLLTQSHIRSSYSLDWCITMYNLGSAFYSSSKPGLIDIRSYHSLSEAASGVRYLLYYHQHEMDNLENQILRRLFWLIFAGSWYVRSTFPTSFTTTTSISSAKLNIVPVQWIYWAGYRSFSWNRMN